MPRFVLTSRTFDSIRSQDMTKTALTRLCALFIYQMCKGGGSPYKLVGTEKKSRILLGYFWTGPFKNYQYF
jgi:hypothetical protein